MKTFKQLLAALMIIALTAFGAAIAQNDQEQDQEQQTQEEQAQEETQTRTFEIRGEDVAPLGEIQVGESRSYEQSETRTVEVEVQTGAIIIRATTPGDERPNIDLVGPSGYFEHFEVSTNDDGEHIVNGLLPGVYSLAATDDGLQVAHTVLEVTPGQAVSVDITLQELATFEEGAFQPDARTNFPDEAFQAEERQAIENTEFGEVTVQTESDNARFIMTGPNNYSQEFTGTFTASDLAPGVYVIAGTIEESYQVEGALTGAEIATSAVAVNVSQAVTMVPVYDIVGAEVEEVEGEAGDVEDVAGGGEAEQQEAEQQEAEQQETEQQQEQEQEEERQQDEQQEGQQEGEVEDREGEEVAGGGEAQQEQTVQVGLTEYSIDMPDQISAGSVTFEITNNGEEEHSFEIEGQGIEESLDQNLQPGESTTLTVDLQAGTYTVYCPVGDHEEEGMTMQLEVTEQGG